MQVMNIQLVAYWIMHNSKKMISWLQKIYVNYPNAMQQINFTGSLDRAKNAMSFIVEEVK